MGVETFASAALRGNNFYFEGARSTFHQKLQTSEILGLNFELRGRKRKVSAGREALRRHKNP